MNPRSLTVDEIKSRLPSALTIELPLPPKCLSPNARVHWAQKSFAVKAVRLLAKIKTNAIEWNKPRHKTATVSIEWFTKTVTRPDGDNALASLKAAFDGVTDSGFLSDDKGLTFLPIVFAKDAKNPRVRITFKP